MRLVIGGRQWLKKDAEKILLAELYASEQRHAYWLKEWAKRWEDGDNGDIYDMARALELEVRQHWRNELRGKRTGKMFHPALACNYQRATRIGVLESATIAGSGLFYWRGALMAGVFETIYQKLTGKAIRIGRTWPTGCTCTLEYSDSKAQPADQADDYYEIYGTYVWTRKAISKIAENVRSLPIYVYDRNNEAMEGHILRNCSNGAMTPCRRPSFGNSM